MPVPMAVPPSGSRRRRFKASSMRPSAEPNWADQAPNSWAKVSGMASIRWVRPVLTILPRPRARLSMVLRRCLSAGSSDSIVSSWAETRMAVGITSLELCPRLTWSLGCTAVLPALPLWLARVAMTSLAFILDEVPEPVWYTSIGKCWSWAPMATSVAADWIALPTPLGSRPRPVLTSAAAPLIKPSARMKARGMRCPDTGKFCTARWVCAPHRASAGTCSSPMLSRSVRKPALETLLIINSAQSHCWGRESCGWRWADFPGWRLRPPYPPAPANTPAADGTERPGNGEGPGSVEYAPPPLPNCTPP